MEKNKVVEATIVEDNTKKGSEKTNHQDEKAITYLSYLGILCLIPFLIKKESDFVQFHAKQGLVLAIGWFLASFFYHFFLLGLFLHLAIVVFSVQGLLAVSRGERKKFPIISDIAEKIKL